MNVPSVEGIPLNVVPVGKYDDHGRKIGGPLLVVRGRLEASAAQLETDSFLGGWNVIVRLRRDTAVRRSADCEQGVGVHLVHPVYGEAPISTDSAGYGIQPESSTSPSDSM